METNKVILDLKEYNELRDFKKEIEAGNTYTVCYDWNSAVYKYISTDEVLKSLAEELEDKQKIINDLRHPDKKEPNIYELKEMSWWEFRKWKAGKL